MAFTDHFSSLASRYAEFRPTYPPALFAWLAEIVPTRALAWDCACGSGQASIGLAQHFARVIATDASEAQITAAKPHNLIEYCVALAQCSGLAAQSVDLITVAQAVHWFDLDAFYAEVRRVLKPGGILALWTYSLPVTEDGAVQACIRAFYEDIVGPYWPPEHAHLRAHYRTLPFPFAGEIAAPDFYTSMLWTLDQLRGFFHSWSATKSFIKAKGFDPVALQTERLTALWGVPSSARLFVMPLFMRVARL